jgi:hypothetical protein
MSFILDALRKVDHENRQGSDPAPPIVAVARLKKERVHRRRQLSVMGGIALLSAVGTAILMRRSSLPEPPAPIERTVAAAPVLEIPVEELTLATPAVVTPERPTEPEPEAERKPAPEVPRTEPEATAETAAPVAPTPIEATVRLASTPEPLPELPALVLQGTSVLDGKPVAVVSDRRVFEGDTIEGAVVIRIDERSVELEFQGRRFTLTF